MRLCIRLYIDGKLQSEEFELLTNRNCDGLVQEVAARHATFFREKVGMMEIEFLDETDLNERFFRVGTDPTRMVMPLNVDLT